ncbi:acetyl-CoA acetyltransferase [Plakobranchus ocellatus]|uniref:Acetyl-CoA acetyltransferase n=1 Tax=Plakobranchus ocellatus TaxID=259542 RepID=A0AAV4AFB7_9GAST|nr:acetyl-CoA acetyltransferase [Plakobranchus ocellatus]
MLSTQGGPTLDLLPLTKRRPHTWRWDLRAEVRRSKSFVQERNTSASARPGASCSFFHYCVPSVWGRRRISSACFIRFSGNGRWTFRKMGSSVPERGRKDRGVINMATNTLRAFFQRAVHLAQDQNPARSTKEKHEIAEQEYSVFPHSNRTRQIYQLTMALAKAVKGVYIVAAKRTAFGTFGGKLKNVSATDLGIYASQAALQAGKVKPEDVNSIVFGNVITSAVDGIYSSRHIGLKCGVPLAVPALTVNRLCGSGFQAIVTGAQEIMLGLSDIVLAGGIENMSQTPYAVRNIRFGTRLGENLRLEDQLWESLTDSYCKLPMGMTAENLAEKYNFTREDCDRYAVQTQDRWRVANETGVFKDEIIPVPVKGKKGQEMFEVDEHPRAATMEAMAKLPPVFKKNGTINAGNASGIVDGGCALVLASEAAVQKHSLEPLAKIISYGISGCEPSIMGIGPVPSSKAALAAIGKEVKDMDVVEVNEAFAPQFLAVRKELGLDNDKTNVNGGAIALGHPLGASGARITTNLTYDIRRRGLQYALGSACIGGGQGITVIIERV